MGRARKQRNRTIGQVTPVKLTGVICQSCKRDMGLHAHSKKVDVTWERVACKR